MKLFVITVSAITMSSAAFAGGYVAPVAAPAPVVVTAPVMMAPDWSGFYAGLQYGQGSAEVSGFGVTVDAGDFDAYGLHAGYTRDFGQFVLGGELDYNKVDFDDADEDGDLVRLRARAGYDAGRFLPYATLGVARVSGDIGDDSVSETGVTYGIGADFRVTDSFTLGLEYSRNDFSDVLEDELGTSGVDLDTDLVQVRASYRF